MDERVESEGSRVTLMFKVAEFPIHGRGSEIYFTRPYGKELREKVYKET